MPQVDLESLVAACAGVSCDRKIACETLADTASAAETTTTTNAAAATTALSDPQELPPDFPPESFWLSKDAELDWLDRNAFIERKDSTKGSSISTNLNPNIHSGSNSVSNSQRYSNLKSKASIIGLPKPQKSCFVESKNRRHCKAANTRLFPPKRCGSTGKSDPSLVEPSSPKVSCMGRVRSKRDRKRRLRHRQRSIKEKPDLKTQKPESKHKPGFFAVLGAIFGKRERKNLNDKSFGGSLQEEIVAVSTSRDIRDRLPPRERDAPPRKSVGSTDGGEPAGLGAVMRFSSGRRSDAWVVGIDMA